MNAATKHNPSNVLRSLIFPSTPVKRCNDRLTKRGLKHYRRGPKCQPPSGGDTYADPEGKRPAETERNRHTSPLEPD